MATEQVWDLSGFQVEDIVRMAIAVEQGGFDFYGRIMEGSDNKRVNNELRFLRDEEARHREFFQARLAAMGAAADKKLGPKVQKLLDTQFIEPIQELYRSGKIENNAQALGFGMTIEQKTVDFYSALRDSQTDQEFRAELELIIEEERKHRRKLNLILAY